MASKQAKGAKAGKKGKGKTMDLAQFASGPAVTSSGGYVPPGRQQAPFPAMGDVLSQLPKAPKAKVEGEEAGWDQFTKEKHERGYARDGPGRFDR